MTSAVVLALALVVTLSCASPMNELKRGAPSGGSFCNANDSSMVESAVQDDHASDFDNIFAEPEDITALFETHSDQDTHLNWIDSYADFNAPPVYSICELIDPTPVQGSTPVQAESAQGSDQTSAFIGSDLGVVPARFVSDLYHPDSVESAIQDGQPTEIGNSYDEVADFPTLFESHFYNDTFLNEIDDTPDFYYQLPSVPSSSHAINRGPAEESIFVDAESAEPSDLETVRGAHSGFNPNFDINSEMLHALIPMSELVSSEDRFHLDAVQDPDCVTSTVLPAPIRANQKRKGEAQNVDSPGRQRKSVSNILTPARDIASYGIDPLSVSTSESDRSSSSAQGTHLLSPYKYRLRLAVLLPHLAKLKNLDQLQVDALKYQEVADSWSRTLNVGRIPNLSNLAQDRIDLFAAHYLLHFPPNLKKRLPRSEIAYRRSLECLLLCFYGHCAGNRDEFNKRFPNWGQRSFDDTCCNGILQCTHEINEPRPTPEPEKSGNFCGRRLQVQRIVLKLVLSEEVYAKARSSEEPPPTDSVVPRLSSAAAWECMEVVVAHYLVHFGLGGLQKGPLARRDGNYRNSLECIIICYYEHCGGNEGLFRERFGKPVLEYFRCRCNGKVECNWIQQKAASRMRMRVRRLKSF